MPPVPQTSRLHGREIEPAMALQIELHLEFQQNVLGVLRKQRSVSSGLAECTVRRG